VMEILVLISCLFDRGLPFRCSTCLGCAIALIVFVKIPGKFGNIFFFFFCYLKFGCLGNFSSAVLQNVSMWCLSLRRSFGLLCLAPLVPPSFFFFK